MSHTRAVPNGRRGYGWTPQLMKCIPKACAVITAPLESVEVGVGPPGAGIGDAGAAEGGAAGRVGRDFAEWDAPAEPVASMKAATMATPARLQYDCTDRGYLPRGVRST